MFEPRPEISTATRLRSGIVGRGPAAVRPGHSAPALPRLDSTDASNRFPRALELRGHLIRYRSSDDHDHPDAAIEGAYHLLRFDVAAFLQQLEKSGERLIKSYKCVAIVR